MSDSATRVAVVSDAATRAEVCATAIADNFRGDGEILVSCFGSVPSVGARLAKLTSEPDLLMTDGIASLVDGVQPVSGKRSAPVPEAWMPFRSVFDLLWGGQRHVVMMASQVDRYGNQNFSAVGPHAKLWVVDRETARIVASPDHKSGDLGDLGLEHPGRMLTEAGGTYSTRLTRHAVVAWRAVPGRNDVGVVVIVYEPTSDFDATLGWELLLLLAVVGAGVLVAGKR